jgi:putative endonuclease
MYYVYVIKSKGADQLYVGFSSDLRKRIIEHNSGESLHTKKYLPWILVYYEAYLSKKDAMERERQLKKHAKGLAMLKKRISDSLKKPKGVG